MERKSLCTDSSMHEIKLLAHPQQVSICCPLFLEQRGWASSETSPSLSAPHLPQWTSGDRTSSEVQWVPSRQCGLFLPGLIVPYTESGPWDTLWVFLNDWTDLFHEEATALAYFYFFAIAATDNGNNHNHNNRTVSWVPDSILCILCAYYFS